MDAQTMIAQKIMTTNVDDKTKIYVQALRLAIQEDSFIYHGDVSIFLDCPIHCLLNVPFQ